jgi:hypothetical protein
MQIKVWLPNKFHQPSAKSSYLTRSHAVFPAMSADGMICRQVALSDGKVTQKPLAASLLGDTLRDHIELYDGSTLQVIMTSSYGRLPYATLVRVLPNGVTESREIGLPRQRQFMGILNGRYALFGFDAYLCVDCFDLTHEIKSKVPAKWIEPTVRDSQRVIDSQIIPETTSIVEVTRTAAGDNFATVYRLDTESRQWELVTSWEISRSANVYGSNCSISNLRETGPRVWTVAVERMTIEARDTKSWEVSRVMKLPVTEKYSMSQCKVIDHGITLQCIEPNASWSMQFAIEPEPSTKISKIRSGSRFGSNAKPFVYTYSADGPGSFLRINDETSGEAVEEYSFRERHSSAPTFSWDGGDKAFLLGDYNNPFVLEVDVATGKIIKGHNLMRQVMNRLLCLAAMMVLVCSALLIHTYWFQLPALPAVMLSLAAVVVPNMYWRSQVYWIGVTDLCDQLMLIAYATMALLVVFGSGRLGTRILASTILTVAFVLLCRWLMPYNFGVWDIRISNYVQTCIGTICLMALVRIYLIRKSEETIEAKNRRRLSILDFLLLMAAVAFMFSAIRGVGAFGFRWERAGANLLHIIGLGFLLGLPMVAMLSDKKIWVRLIVAILCITIGLMLLATFHRIRGDSFQFISASKQLSLMSPLSAIKETGINMSIAIAGVCLVSAYLYACKWRIVNRVSKSSIASLKIPH